MSDLEYIVTVLGIFYGILLMFVAFVKTPFTEAMRIDALFMPKPTEATRLLNLVIGLLLIGYLVFTSL